MLVQSRAQFSKLFVNNGMKYWQQCDEILSTNATEIFCKWGKWVVFSIVYFTLDSFYRKDTEPSYHSQMYSLAQLLSV